MSKTAVHYKPIGVIRTEHVVADRTPIQPAYANGCGGRVEVFPEYAEGLRDLEGFSHIYLIYHFHESGPDQAAKVHQNQMVQKLLPDLRMALEAAPDRLAMAVRLAIAGNVIDMGVNGNITESDVRRSIQHALTEPFWGDWEAFRQAVSKAGSILYLADNAGEILFDRLLIEQLSPERVTLAVRGAPVLHDATMADARAAGLHEIVEIIDNGSDIAGTVLKECSRSFLDRLSGADMILAKGRGNFETLSDEPGNIFFLFKAKCAVIAAHAGVPVGAHVLVPSKARPSAPGGRS